MLITKLKHLFTKHKGLRLGKISNIKPDVLPNSYLTPTTRPIEAFGFLPLVGKEICAHLAKGLYPGAQHTPWTIQKTIFKTIGYL